MCDIYYNATKTALGNVEGEDISFLNEGYIDIIETLCGEVDSLLDEYLEKYSSVEELEERVSELESLLDENNISF